MLKAGLISFSKKKKKKNRIRKVALNTVALTLIFLHIPTCLMNILICWMQSEHETKGYWNIKNAVSKICGKKVD